MRRRKFIALLSSAAAVWPLAAWAQQAKRLPLIAIVYSIGSTTDMAGADPLGVNMRAFERGLRDLGWIDGRTVTIERRSTEGDPQRAAAILAEVVARRPDVIMLGGARWLHEAALHATRTIPIVAPFGEDPVAAGLISSLARPGGNLTGVTRTPGPEFYGKGIEFLREAAPNITRPAFLAPREALDAFQAVGRHAGITIIPISADVSEQLDAGFASILREGADALLVPSGPIFLLNAKRIAAFAIESKLPGLFGMRQSVEAGGLMSYGPSIMVLYRQMARQVDRILNGTRPEEIPAERPTTFELVINAKAAAALSLTIPPTLLVLADEVIE
jgi:putative tryptophan/tyrosine transport system substrate-binding protein